MANSSGSDREVAAAWDLKLDQEDYVAGDTIHGVVVLTVHETIAFEALTADITGVEVVTWVEEGNNTDGDVSAASYSRRSQALSDKVVITSGSSSYEPGMYEFAVEYTLPSSIPGAFQFKSARVGAFERIAAELGYSIRLSTIKARDEGGEAIDDVGKTFPITVLRPPSWRPRNVRALGNTVSNTPPELQRSISSELIEVTSKVDGCSLSAIIDSVTHFSGDTIKVLCRIERDPTAIVELEAISLGIVEDLEVRVAADKKQATSKTLCQQRVLLSVESPAEKVLSLDLSSSTQQLAPSLNSCFLQWQYRLAVVCEASDKQPGPSVEFPVAILS